MSSRHQRRADLSRYRGLARRGLITWLVDINDPLRDAPLLQRTRDWWFASLPSWTPRRGCLICESKFLSRLDVGAIMYSVPAGNGIGADSVGVVGLCVTCWGTADKPGVSLAEIEEAGTKVLRSVIANGVFGPLGGSP